jgi:large subunit ribosomal protein L3
MGTIRSPRHGSLQFWHRVRASRPYPRIRTHKIPDETKLSGFAGYKAGMTHVIIADSRPNSMTKGQSIAFPVTVVECPPIKIASIRLYKRSHDGFRVSAEYIAPADKNLARRLSLPKKASSMAAPELNGVADVRVLVYTQPQLAGVGKKRPEVFELAVGGKTPQEKFDYAKSLVGKDIAIADVFKEGQQVDVFAVTKGKGFQGPVKRFGVTLRQHKAQKTKRGPANVGPWTGNRSWTVSHAGQMGYHNRQDKNKWLLKIGSNPSEANVAGGFLNYGILKSSFILLKGSIPGPAKRIVRLAVTNTPNHHVPNQAPAIELVSKHSPQGN